jgi:hypothetical protein
MHSSSGLGLFCGFRRVRELTVATLTSNHIESDVQLTKVNVSVIMRDNLPT